MSPRTLAIIGYGKIAADQHIPALHASDAFELAAVVSGHAREIPGVPRIFPKAQALYEAAPEIGCVAICGSPATRYDDARAALLAGKHVLMEKPPAATLAEAHALAALAERQGVTLFASWHARANAAVEAAAERLKDAEIVTLAVTWKEDVRRWHPGQAWLWAPGGFGVFDPGINALSIVTAILPQPVFVRSARLSVPSNQQSPIAAELGFAGPPGASSMTAVFDWRQTGEQTWEVDVATADGQALRLTGGGARLEVDGREITASTGDVEYPRLYARFAELIDQGASEVDTRPLELVADAFLRGERVAVEAFDP